jgi:voltage-gated potassium channel
MPAVYFKIVITTVILWDSLLFIFGTDERIYQQNPGLFAVSEGVVSCIFALEYILRLYTCTERPKYQNKRLQYMLTPAALIDLFATLPYFLEILIPSVQLPTLTYLRVFRLARILKTAGFIGAMDAVYRVIYYNREVLYVALWMCLALTLGTSILLYTLRPMDVDRSDLDNLDDFHSIPATLYMATLMLTGQGGPDAEHLPWYTRSVILITAVFSVAMFAIPASMLTWGFEAGKLNCVSFQSSISPLALVLSSSNHCIFLLYFLFEQKRPSAWQREHGSVR